jgi:hypothetical protein
VDVVAGEVERDEPLEDDGPARPGGREENEEASGGAAVRHHVENSAELGRLFKVPRGISVQGIEQAGYAVERRAGARMKGHIVEGGEGKQDARVACCTLDCSHPASLSQHTDEVWVEEEDILLLRILGTPMG